MMRHRHVGIVGGVRKRFGIFVVGGDPAISNLESDQTYNLPTIELNWSGIGEVTANIIAGGRRDLDAFFVVQGHDHVLFHERSLWTTNPRYHLPKLGPGRYEIEYAVVSANFATVASRYLLEFDGRRESVRFREIRGGKETAKI